MVNRVPLGEVCDFIRGVAFDGNEAIDLPKEGYVPILRAGNIGDELYIREDLVWVPEKRVSNEQLFQIGDIAICMASGSPAVLGKTAQLKENFVGSVGAFCGIIRPTKADAGYISYWLKSPEFMAWRNSQANGVNIQNLRPNEIREIELPLPPLTEQKRIASLLARADRLRGLRRHAKRLADSLLQSVFLEMFGEPVNSKKWKVEKLEGFTTLISSGSTPLGGANVYKPSGIRFIRSQNVLMNEFDFSDVAFIEEDIYNSMKRTAVKRNDVLLNITGASIGRVACYQDNIPANVNQHVCIIRCKPDKLNPIYLSHVISMPTFQEQILANQSGATRQALTFEQIREFKIPLPPLPLQEEFARAAARVESLRRRMAESERQAEGLFQALLAESFGQ